MLEYETKSSSNGREEILNEAKFYVNAYSDKFEKGNYYNEEKISFKGCVGSLFEMDNDGWSEDIYSNDEKLSFYACKDELEIENENKNHTHPERFQNSDLDCASDMQNNYQNNTHNTHDSKDKKKINRKKSLKPTIIKKIIKLFCKLVVCILNNSKKFNHNIRFRNIKPIKLNKISINKLMKKNIKQFCELEISESITRYNSKKMNKIFLQKTKSKWGDEFLKLKLSDIYKKIFLLKTKEKGDYINFPLKKLIKKDINNLGNYLIIEKKYIFNKVIEKYEVDDRKYVKQIANELLSKKK